MPKGKKLKSEDPGVILGACISAFAQGAGSVPVSRETVRYIQKRYARKVRDHGSTWDQDEADVLECARALGRASAFNALASGSSAVRPRDFSAAADAMEEVPLSLAPQRPIQCPWC